MTSSRPIPPVGAAPASSHTQHHQQHLPSRRKGGLPPPDQALGPLNESFKFFLANLPSETTPVDVRTFFSQFGVVNFVKIIYNRQTGLSNGYGFLYMNDSVSDAAVWDFALQQGQRIRFMGSDRVLLQRDDQHRKKPLRNKFSHDEDKIVIPAAAAPLALTPPLLPPMSGPAAGVGTVVPHSAPAHFATAPSSSSMMSVAGHIPYNSGGGSVPSAPLNQFSSTLPLNSPPVSYGVQPASFERAPYSQLPLSQQQQPYADSYYQQYQQGQPSANYSIAYGGPSYGPAQGSISNPPFYSQNSADPSSVGSVTFSHVQAPPPIGVAGASQPLSYYAPNASSGVTGPPLYYSQAGATSFSQDSQASGIIPDAASLPNSMGYTMPPFSGPTTSQDFSDRSGAGAPRGPYSTDPYRPYQPPQQPRPGPQTSYGGGPRGRGRGGPHTHHSQQHRQQRRDRPY